MAHMKVTARLEPGAAAAFEALAAADGATMTTVINRALLDTARARGLIDAAGTTAQGDLEARVAALETWRRETEQERGG